VRQDRAGRRAWRSPVVRGSGGPAGEPRAGAGVPRSPRPSPRLRPRRAMAATASAQPWRFPMPTDAHDAL
ncbi:MAG: hypothetical protein AVDCRST_MAG08-2036, partial [uncultured Acetobacteraceae bacterium]